jgi:hypothetical protein
MAGHTFGPGRCRNGLKNLGYIRIDQMCFMMNCSKNSCITVHIYDKESVYGGYTRVVKSEAITETTNMALLEMAMVRDSGNNIEISNCCGEC